MITVAALGLIGILAWLNPTQQAFEAFARDQLVIYLDETLCRELAPSLEHLLSISCNDMLVQNQALLDTLIQEQTQHYNFVVFSIYRTTLALPTFGLLPTYQVDTLGILGQFYLVQVKQR
jgi:hypothetical protein